MRESGWPRPSPDLDRVLHDKTSVLMLTTDGDHYRYRKDADVRAPGPARAARGAS